MTMNLDDAEVTSLQTYVNNECRVSIFADNLQQQDQLKYIANAVGGNILFSGSASEGLERLSIATAGSVALVTVDDRCGPETKMLLDRLDVLADMDRLLVLVNVSPSWIDRAAVRLRAQSTVLLCDAQTADWLTALALADTARTARMSDVASDDTVRLQRLADEVQRIAKTLADLVDGGPPRLRGVSDAVVQFRSESRAGQSMVTVSGEDVRGLIRLRRLRERYFDADLFADPAWDMLLDLSAARIEKTRVAVSSLCIAAAVPPTTALRWIKTMCENGMFVRVADPEDGRRVFIELADDVATAMMGYLAAAKAAGGLAV